MLSCPLLPKLLPADAWKLSPVHFYSTVVVVWERTKSFWKLLHSKKIQEWRLWPQTDFLLLLLVHIRSPAISLILEPVSCYCTVVLSWSWHSGAAAWDSPAKRLWFLPQISDSQDFEQLFSSGLKVSFAANCCESAGAAGEFPSLDLSSDDPWSHLDVVFDL